MLSGWEELSDTVMLPGKSGSAPLVVYGLDAGAISYIARAHGEVVSTVFAMAVSGKVTLDNLGETLWTLTDEVPFWMAAVIAFGSREPEEIEKAAKLPFAVQVEAVEKIMKLTFAGDYSPKKLAEVIGMPVQMVLQAISGNGSGASAN